MIHRLRQLNETSQCDFDYLYRSRAISIFDKMCVLVIKLRDIPYDELSLIVKHDDSLWKFLCNIFANEMYKYLRNRGV